MLREINVRYFYDLCKFFLNIYFVCMGVKWLRDDGKLIFILSLYVRLCFFFMLLFNFNLKAYNSIHLYLRNGVSCSWHNQNSCMVRGSTIAKYVNIAWYFNNSKLFIYIRWCRIQRRIRHVTLKNISLKLWHHKKKTEQKSHIQMFLML